MLTGLGPEPSALRARVLALRAETGTFLGDTVGAESASAEALDIAGATADRGALIAALRVRRTVRSGPEGLDDRIAVADRLAALAAESDDPDVGLDAHLARFEVALERGDLAAARAELEPIAGRVHGVGGPIARWRLLTCRATTAQAHGRLLEARRLGEEALATLGATPHPAAEAMRVALHGAIDHHLGPAAGPRSALDALTARPAPEAPAVGYRFFDALGAAVLLTDLGRLADAASYYRALGPPGAWRPPPFFAVASRAVAVAVAVAQDDPADVAVLRDHLRPHRDRHVAVPGGTANYGGPVALPLGRASAALGELDDAVDDLEFALSTCSRIGAAGYAVESGEALASVLVRRDGRGDRERARRLVHEAATRASALGMAPFVVRLAALRAGLDARPILTSREREVAAGVARGLTNAQIAAELVVSERTAQNHVQHVLTKLGFSRRSQIAVWTTTSPESPY